ncbi:MAG: FAD-dependent oxidoreductase [Bacteroidota bacterium]
MKRFGYLFFLLCFLACSSGPSTQPYDVIILGSGTGAVSAGIQAARSGAKTLLVHPMPWLGGMLTAAGVSATDGNHRLPAGLWGEFRQHLRTHYGGEAALFTGWVSNTMFEPHVGANIWQTLANAEPNLTVVLEGTWSTIEQGEEWQVAFQDVQGQKTFVQAPILIDGTDLGDVAAQVGAGFDLGMEGQTESQESMASLEGNDIVQDLTYVAILKDFGSGIDHRMARPEGYDPSIFQCACRQNCEDKSAHDCEKMLTYGLLPNDKYMLNWPKQGNDFYANVALLSSDDRQAMYEAAKLKTLQFVYYIQNELGYSHLGLADDEFPTADRLALMPYHREGRRIHGKQRLRVQHLLQPYQYTLYQSGIAVGDYPIDHHHAEHPVAPEIDFPKVPSFSIPMGCLIADDVPNLLLADKAISVSNIVNGSSRLQPVIIQVGQVCGLMGAMAAQQKVAPHELKVRAVQDQLLQVKGYLLPFIDVPPTHPHFAAVQKIGATGILKGKGIPYQWANQTWFYPDTTLTAQTLVEGLVAFDQRFEGTYEVSNTEALTIQDAAFILADFAQILGLTQREVLELSDQWTTVLQLSNFDVNRPITKLELAVLLNHWIDPFQLKPVQL